MLFIRNLAGLVFLVVLPCVAAVNSSASNSR
jgi:hypothetical protein